MMTIGSDRGGQARLSGWAISWRLMFRVKDRANALRKIDEVGRAVGREIEASTCERYWKDESLWECSVRVPMANGSAAELLFDCVVLAIRLGSGWRIDGLGRDGDLAVFYGVFNAGPSCRPHVAGLAWGSFDLIAPPEET